MTPLSRRALLKAGLLSASGAALSHLSPSWGGLGLAGAQERRALTDAARRAAGFPIPGSQWHGDSSVGAALRAPQVPVTGPLANLQASLRPGGPGLPKFTLDGMRFDPDNPSGEIGPPRFLVRTPAERLRMAFPNLRRHFAFEYYPWYTVDPWRHWDGGGHQPPVSVASSMMPALGPYNSGDAAVIEQHARWIADSGAGAIALSWWGRDSYMEQWTPLIMDIMRAHDIHVTFHLEPYRVDRAHFYADDVLYLIRTYGDRRRWDNFLLLGRADGTAAPVFKSFRTILPPTIIDCLGRLQVVPDYTPDHVWRQQTDTLRETFRSTFPGLTLLADSLDVGRTKAGGFDGIAIYDSYVRPHTWPIAARDFGGNQLLFSFAVNCGFSGFTPRVPLHDCDIVLPFEPPIGPVDWTSDASRRAAEEASRGRVLESVDATLALQADPRAFNARSGFFLAYLNTFNEWHEGTSFEPARHRRDLSPGERAVGYHNPENGAWRLELLQSLLRPITANR